MCCATVALSISQALFVLNVCACSYVPRWFRPSYRGTFANIVADPSLLERCDPVRRQLLGAMGDLTDDGLPLNSPLYLFPTDDAHVPLKAWAEERGLISRASSLVCHPATAVAIDSSVAKPQRPDGLS